jgi:flagellar P-ring protein FlgI
MSVKAVLLLMLALTVASQAAGSSGARIKDIARVEGSRTHALVGYGVVSGLAGTGDSTSNRATRQTLSNLLAVFDLTLPPEAISSRNVAVVLVSAHLPNFIRPGATIEVTVTSVGDARSLEGGSLLLTPLKGPDQRTYVLAQGPLTVGGYRFEANGSIGQKNHPTVGTIPGGGLVEVAPPAPLPAEDGAFFVSLLEPDYTNAARVADAINAALGAGSAFARNPDAVEVRSPAAYRSRFVDLIRTIEALEIAPDFRARVVVNERTGTVVSGVDVRIAAAAISVRRSADLDRDGQRRRAAHAPDRSDGLDSHAGRDELPHRPAGAGRRAPHSAGRHDRRSDPGARAPGHQRA